MKFSELISYIQKSPNRMILVMRHGTKMELSERFDLPIYDMTEKYCQDDYKSFEIAKALKNKGTTIIYASPFLRTKQTALRLVQYMKSKQCIFLVDALGESYKQVNKQLRACGENITYRIPKHLAQMDECMRKMVDKTKVVCRRNKCQPEIDWYGDSLKDVLTSKRFSDKYMTDKVINSEADYMNYFKSTLLKLICSDADKKNVIVVTHGNNVRNSLNVLTPRFIPNMSMLPKTCGGVLFEETEPGKFKVIYSNFMRL